MYVRQHGTLIEINTPAKINLFLEIFARRDDGFHEIETLMAPISLYDTLRFCTTLDGRVQLSCEWALGTRSKNRKNSTENPVLEQLPPERDNLVTKAINLLRTRAAIHSGASIQLTKRIPSAAGLGGASSDAAAALVAANLAWSLDWDRSQLADLAAEIGSDVPFFLYPGAAICRGRGEVMDPVRFPGSLPLVIVKPPAGLSTAAVYGRCQVPGDPHNVCEILGALQSGDRQAVGNRLLNRLQPAAAELSPWIRKLQACFDELNCVGHQMSGSGTSYFGICRHVRHAAWVAGRLSAAGLGAVYQAAA